MQQCGFCSMLSGLLRRAMCISSRRGSSESYYRELGDQDTLKIEDRSSILSDDSEEIIQEVPVLVTRVDINEIRIKKKPSLCTGRFLTMHKRRKKSLVTRSLRLESALLDDLQYGQVQARRCLPVLCVHLFHVYGLISYFKLDAVKTWRLFTMIEEGYHSTNPYHNSVHAADVTQAMHCFLQQKQIRDHLEPIEILASLLAAIAHDIDHPGVNQPFLIATSNHLAALYQNTSVLENHHWRVAVSCIIESGLLEVQEIRVKVERQISSLILATDITRQQEFLSQFKINDKLNAVPLYIQYKPRVYKKYLDNNTLDMRNRDHRHLVLQIALKCADISNPCRPWEISRKWSLKVCEEFFRQGDCERKLNLPVTALCDRHTTSIPKIQTGFLKYVVTPLITEWHRFLQNDLSAQMLKNLTYNRAKWESFVVQEIAAYTKTDISEVDVIDDDFETCSGTNMSDSSELLLPLRRCSLNPAKPSGLKEQLRRLSMPLNVFTQDTKFKIIEKSHESLSERNKEIASAIGSANSINSQVSVRSQCEHSDAAEKILSTEKLLPDLSTACITTPAQATRLNTVIKEGGTWKLVRQQTFPPLETVARTRALLSRPMYTSNEDTICPSRQTSEFALTLEERLSNLFKDTDNASETITVGVTDDPDSRLRENFKIAVKPSTGAPRRDSAAVGSQLRDNLSTVQLSSSEQLLNRRKSMPTDATAYSPKEKKMLEIIPQLLRRTLSSKDCWSRRRGSAPAPVAPSELRGLASQGALRHSVNGGRRKPGAIGTCQQWLAKATHGVQERTMQHLPRRASLPVEVFDTSEKPKTNEKK